MKQIFNYTLGLLFLSLVMNACSSSKNATAVRKEVKGAWTLSNVTFAGVSNPEELKIQLFDDGDLSCFTGSTWNLPNNGYGSYTINKTSKNCTVGARAINWSYRQENGETILQFKKLQEGIKAKNIEDGYKLKIVTATAENLLLQSIVNFEGKDLVLDYNFVKTP